MGLPAWVCYLLIKKLSQFFTISDNKHNIHVTAAATAEPRGPAASPGLRGLCADRGRAAAAVEATGGAGPGLRHRPLQGRGGQSQNELVSCWRTRLESKGFIQDPSNTEM